MPSPPNNADRKDMWSGGNIGLAGMAVSLAAVASSSLLSAGGTITAADYVTVLDAVGTAGTFYGYAAVAVLGLVFTWYLVPETKGRTLEEIQQAFVERARGKAS